MPVSVRRRGRLNRSGHTDQERTVSRAGGRKALKVESVVCKSGGFRTTETIMPHNREWVGASKAPSLEGLCCCARGWCEMETCLPLLGALAVQDVAAPLARVHLSRPGCVRPEALPLALAPAPLVPGV